MTEQDAKTISEKTPASRHSRRPWIILGILLTVLLLGAGSLLAYAYHLHTAEPESSKKSAGRELKLSSKEKPAEETITPEPIIEEAPAPAPIGAKGIVVIDAGHQGRGDSTQEPVGPGSSETKARVTSGTRGVSTGVDEHVVTLQVAQKLRTALEAQGITVIMVRESADVNISNAERAQIANNAGADLEIRLHCDGSSSSSTKGFLTLVPGQNQWTGPIVAPSRAAADIMHAKVLASTGAVDRGIQERTDLSGFNWLTVPSVLFEMGLMSNPEEDRLLSDPSYQDKIVQGITAGTVEYLSGH